MIVIIDYGLGNVRAFANVYKRLNIPAAIGRQASDLTSATKLILPGVGSFDHAMELLQGSGMRETIDHMVLQRSVPVLGVCVGMQILAAASDEGKVAGLGWIGGRVRKLPVDTSPTPARLPHMGWNDVRPVAASPLFAKLERDARFYFLHSYYFHCDSRSNVLAEVEHGIAFPCAVHAKNIYGVQFHPEKSHNFGQQLLQNFGEL
jgi:imidazole glycerol-phosphate synthase subunit HisH